ncbi:prephenate dehydrogenase [Clostridium gasigenes]|uniref:Prephenate dehydrogenase n=1 Tax=Clostridium gasigenes TaxID=94869 RepID=A0A1H0TK55_9CLOT|nr:prephenate dehydrogenase [Clostridium gasigenes]MBB6623968.1 prephenate dehydrogenase [Clostridium gasigenes]MBU3088409.1 prephenate dehydrogenase [Clostridium gasigenes]MBU3133242.1 prephenate dehydrogenase [Clostridium gasigenes]SDP54413.1 prephenate dehydrogenase [Clostridium gasigenes]
MRILIVGLGVVGGSYAMALKEAGYEDVYGLDTDLDTLKKAENLRIIKKGYIDGTDIVEKCDLIILSIYPRLVKKFIQDNKNRFKKGTVITDATGIKEMFINDILEILPSNVDFIFGHPMAGREKKGIDYASSKVFKGANYLITTIDSNKEENIKLIEKLAYNIGFKKVRRITPKYHDEMISFTSQLPHAIAVALINSDEEGRDTGSFIGDSYRDLTRIANINEELWSELFLGNKSNLIKVIDEFEVELKKIKIALENNNNKCLKELFVKSTKRREKL